MQKMLKNITFKICVDNHTVLKWDTVDVQLSIPFKFAEGKQKEKKSIIKS